MGKFKIKFKGNTEMMKKMFFSLVIAIIVIMFQQCNQPEKFKENLQKEVVIPADFNGKWKLIADTSISTLIDLYEKLSIGITVNNSNLTMIQKWGEEGIAFKDTLHLKTDGSSIDIPIHNRVFPTHPFMGLKMPVGEKRTMKAYWDGGILKIDETFNVLWIAGTQSCCSSSFV